MLTEQILAEKISIRDLIDLADTLVEDGSNPEYGRALVELIIYAGSLSMEEAPAIAEKIGVSVEVFKS